ncbi:MAG: hypothetical protein EBX36_04080 [Planctomycetia bacterium]|nr:hypothetical protein [Planctomycetia bacterium]
MVRMAPVAGSWTCGSPAPWNRRTTRRATTPSLAGSIARRSSNGPGGVTATRGSWASTRARWTSTRPSASAWRSPRSSSTPPRRPRTATGSAGARPHRRPGGSPTSPRRGERPAISPRYGAVASSPSVVPGFGTVRPAWEEGEAGTTGPDGEPRTTTLFIDPGIGFGTGEHATTRLCLEALAAWHDAGGGLDRVLDFGAGSGILGIAAALRGASHVAAIEIDTRVHEAIRANARRNGVHGTLRVATHLEDVPAACDLVIANIVAAVLLEHADPLCRLVRRPAASAGGLILSGLRDTDVAAVREAFSRRLDASPRHAARDGWHCLLFTASGR